MAQSSSLVTARALILLQLLSRLLTFGLNQALVRLAPPEVFGTAAIQFDLISSTILFLSREGIRNALLRSRSASLVPSEAAGGADRPNVAADGPSKLEDIAVRRKQDTALATVPFWAGLLVSAGTLVIYLARLPASTSAQRDFHLSLSLYVIAALLELAIEPHYLAALRSSPPRIRVRVQAEGGMAIVRAVVTVASVLLFSRSNTARDALEKGTGSGGGRPLLAFAFGQLAGGIWLAGRYIWNFGVQGLMYVPSIRFNPGTLSLALANTRQSFIKHLLTEADRIAVGIVCPLEDQGGYAVAMNYVFDPSNRSLLVPWYCSADILGSLVARIIFQPLEETLLLHFSSVSPSSALRTLALSVRLSSYLLLLLPVFLPPLLPAVLPVLLPRRYLSASAPTILRIYLSSYIPLLSLNGILEAYHAATATPTQVKRQIGWMVASSVGFVTALYLQAAVLGWKAEIALIYASCFAMVIRIAYAYKHARSHAISAASATNLMGVAQLIPDWRVVVVTGLSGAALRFLRGTDESWKGLAAFLGLGAGLGIATLAIIVHSEKAQVLRVWKGKVD